MVWLNSIPYMVVQSNLDNNIIVSTIRDKGHTETVFINSTLNIEAGRISMTNGCDNDLRYI